MLVSSMFRLHDRSFYISSGVISLISIDHLPEGIGFLSCAVSFLGKLIFVFVLQRLQEEQVLFLLKRLDRYCGA